MTTEKLERVNALRRQMDGIKVQLESLIIALECMSKEDENPHMFIEFDTDKANRSFGIYVSQNHSTSDKEICIDVAERLLERLKVKHEAVKKEFEAL